MAKIQDTIEPEPDNVDSYDNRLFPIYRNVYYALNDAGIYSQLSQLY